MLWQLKFWFTLIVCSWRGHADNHLQHLRGCAWNMWRGLRGAKCTYLWTMRITSSMQILLGLAWSSTWKNSIWWAPSFLQSPVLLGLIILWGMLMMIGSIWWLTGQHGPVRSSKGSWNSDRDKDAPEYYDVYYHQAHTCQSRSLQGTETKSSWCLRSLKQFFSLVSAETTWYQWFIVWLQ